MSKSGDAVLVLDCGATNVRATVVDASGQILGRHSLPNQTAADPNLPGGIIWDTETIWNILCECSRNVTASLKDTPITAITVTTFGVDGTFCDPHGRELYPVISWACDRTLPVTKAFDKIIDQDLLYSISGLQPFHYNTIYKLAWLKEHRPEILSRDVKFLFISNLILHRLTGLFVTDATMAGTSMLTDYRSRTFSPAILSAIGYPGECFPEIVEAGTLLGKILPGAAAALGLDPQTKVVTAGHDTQFAVIGSGVGMYEPVLSSGTWEILMVRAESAGLKLPGLSSGVTAELDAHPGISDLGVQWVASGILEWISHLFFQDLEGDPLKYQKMIQEAETIEPGCDGLSMLPQLLPGGLVPGGSQWKGFSMHSTRAHFYRSALEGLAFHTRYGLELLQQAAGFKANIIRCSGGGSRNNLWNQIRADVLGIPVEVSEFSETTVLGAALTAMKSIRLIDSADHVFRQVETGKTVYCPQENSSWYQQAFLQNPWYHSKQP